MSMQSGRISGRRRAWSRMWCAAVVLSASCESGETRARRGVDGSGEAGKAIQDTSGLNPRSISGTPRPDTVLFVGTSLTAGYGLAPDSAYPQLIQQKIDSAALPYVVLNAGVSGETSAGLLGRLDWLLR